MSFSLPLYVRYLVRLYVKNLLITLFGLSFTFAIIDYFQRMQQVDIAGNYKILYIFYMWQEALGLLYPLAIVFALIMTKISLIKHNTMGAFHAFGFSKKRLLQPLFWSAFVCYLLFALLQMSSFSYAKERAHLLLKNEIESYNVNDIFFKYNDDFVYIHALDPLQKRIDEITIFNVKNNQVQYTIHAPYALFNGEAWHAKDAVVKTHLYHQGRLIHYRIEKKETLVTLKGYKPKIIESLYEGKSLSVLDAYYTWRLLSKQHINTDKIRALVYSKLVMPLFSLALLVILFLKLPFHSRMMSVGSVVALSLGVTFVIWGLLFGLNQIGSNGVLAPELTVVLPIVLLWLYTFFLYWYDEKQIG